jgi:hypothetical protein
VETAIDVYLHFSWVTTYSTVQRTTVFHVCFLPFRPCIAYIYILFGTSALAGFQQILAGTGVQINYAEGCKLWSASEDGFPEAVAAAQNSDVAVVAVGTWSLDQTLLWSGVSNQHFNNMGIC